TLLLCCLSPDSPWFSLSPTRRSSDLPGRSSPRLAPATARAYIRGHEPQDRQSGTPGPAHAAAAARADRALHPRRPAGGLADPGRSEEHTSELQSRENLVCRLLLEKKK